MASTPCRFKDKCNKKDCPHSHELPPRPTRVNPTLCRYGEECRTKNCIFTHLKPPKGTTATRPDCRNDVDCRRVNCFFNHPNGRLIDRNMISSLEITPQKTALLSHTENRSHQRLDSSQSDTSSRDHYQTSSTVTNRGVRNLHSATASASSREGYGIIILGNSGVGKSFLANVLLGREAFVHCVAARAVTTETEFEEIRMGNENYAIFNIPGLIEADEQRIEMNKREVDKAFVQRPTSLICYVFGEQGGRIRDEDVVAFNALNKAYPLKSESLALIVNGVAKDRPRDYEGEVIVLLKELIDVPFRSLCVLDKIDTNNQAERKTLKNKLLQVIVEGTPHSHFKKQDIELHREEVRKAKEEIKTLQAAFQQNQKIYEKQIKEQQTQYDQMFAEIRKENQQMRLLAERQAEEVKRRDAAHLKAIQEANERANKLQAAIQAERQAREQAEQRAREQAAQIAREQVEQRAREQAAQIAREQAAQIAREQAAQRAREQAEQRAREQAAQRAREQAAQRAREQAACTPGGFYRASPTPGGFCLAPTAPGGFYLAPPTIGGNRLVTPPDRYNQGLHCLRIYTPGNNGF